MIVEGFILWGGLLLLSLGILHLYFNREAKKHQAALEKNYQKYDWEIAQIKERLDHHYQELKEAQSLDALSSTANELVAANIALGRQVKRLEQQLDDCLDSLQKKR